MNILILSCGIRNKIVQYFQNALKGDGIVVCTDSSELAPALYEADKYYVVPRTTAPEYLDIILDICKKEKISGVLSLIDSELLFLAKNDKAFEEIGTQVIGSSYDLCEMSLDKFKMYQWLNRHNYNCAKSYINKEIFFNDVEQGKINYPVFVKPIRGSASNLITKVNDKETIDLLFAHEKELMIQEFLTGEEFGVDVYIDLLSNEVVSIFAKKKLKMRAGETDKAVSVKDRRLFMLIEKFTKECGYLGQIDIDIFKVGGEYYISEVNPRFGGGYPHAYECGCDHMELILNNLNRIVNNSTIGNYNEGVYMMKYVDLKVKDS